MSTDGEEFPITVSKELNAQIAADPMIAKAMQALNEKIRQAHHAVQIGQYASMDDALEVLTGYRPEKCSLDGEPLEGDAYEGVLESIELVSVVSIEDTDEENEEGGS